jgi:hypothetical protein
MFMAAAAVCFFYLLEGVGIRGVWSRPGGNEGVCIFLNMYNQMLRRMLCVGEGGVGRGEPTMLKTCCKHSLEEGVIVAKKVRDDGLVRMEVALHSLATCTNSCQG